MVDQVEDVVEVWFDGGDGLFDERCEEVDGIGVDAGAFVLCSMKDGFADVARKRE